MCRLSYDGTQKRNSEIEAIALGKMIFVIKILQDFEMKNFKPNILQMKLKIQYLLLIFYQKIQNLTISFLNNTC